MASSNVFSGNFQDSIVEKATAIRDKEAGKGTSENGSEEKEEAKEEVKAEVESKEEVKEEKVEETTEAKSEDKESKKAEDKEETKEVKEDTKTEEKTEEKVTEKVAEKKEEKTKPEWWEVEGKKGKTETATEDIGSDIITKAKAYDQIMADPEVEAFVTAKKAGKDLISYINEIKGVDIDKLTPEQLYKTELQNNGLSEEEVSTEMENFDEMSKYQKILQTNSIKDKLAAGQQKKLKEFSQHSKDEIQKQSDFFKIAQEELEKQTAEIIGKKWFGVEVTSEMAEENKRLVFSGTDAYNEDGSWNVPYLRELAFIGKNLPLIVKVAVNKEREKTRKEDFEQVTRPSENKTETRIPTNDPEDPGKKTVDWFLEGLNPKKI